MAHGCPWLPESWSSAIPADVRKYVCTSPMPSTEHSWVLNVCVRKTTPPSLTNCTFPSSSITFLLKIACWGCVLFLNKPVQHMMWSWNVARWTIHRSLWPCPSFNRVWWPKAIPILPSIYPQLYRYGWSTKQTNQKNIKPWGLPWFELCTPHNPTCWCWNPMKYNEFPLNHFGSWLNLNKSVLLTVESH